LLFVLEAGKWYNLDMNIYANHADREVYLEVPVDANAGTIEVEILKDGEVVFTVDEDNLTIADGRYSFDLPFSLARTDSEYEVHWQFQYTENGTTFEYDDYTPLEVVTPILPFTEVKKVLGEDFSDEEAVDVEKAVRYIIQAHTGQFFGKFVGKISVTGSGESYLRLPRKLISFSTINGSAHWNNALALRGSGWYLKSKTLSGPPPIRADWDGWNEATAYSGHVPIVAPYSQTLNKFANNFEYEIDGVWGWASVPAAVQEAAKLLINDYACADSNYRDRFLTSMTAADWRIQFHDAAFSNTGNVRANQLLAEYVLHRGWVVV
jgi:hypothetical protein